MLNHPAEIPVYRRWSFRPVRGRGAELWDVAGRRYLDLYGGHAVTSLGHSPPAVVEALREQAESLLFYSNVAALDVRERFLEALARVAPLPRAFLVSTGAEANEVALAVARRATGRPAVVSVEGGFHGRTLGALAASGIERYRRLALQGGAGAELVRRTRVARFDDPDDLDRLVDDDVAAVILEPVQGMAGARAHSWTTLAAARRICDERGALLVFDEVQCGAGRAGALTAAQAYGVVPDLLTLAKGIAGGVPMGVVLASEAVAATVGAGDLGTTFGGGPLACAAGAAVLAVLERERLPRRAAERGALLRALLTGLPGVREVRGLGLLLGVVLDRPAAPVREALLERGVVVGTSAEPDVLRLMPPLTIDEAQCREAAAVFRKVLS